MKRKNILKMNKRHGGCSEMSIILVIGVSEETG